MMKANNYRKMMEDIHTPAKLNDRVLFAARREEAPGPSPRAVPRRAWLRAAVCAACALALLLGTLTFRPAEEAGVPAEDGALVPVWSFGLAACAADTGETRAAGVNGGLAMETGGGMYWTREGGYYTGCLFQITGAGIRAVSLSLDRGELYRYRRLTDLTQAQIQEIREAQEAGTMAPFSIDQDENGSWSVQDVARLGSSVEESYDPETRYGFWVSGEDAGDLWNTDPRAASRTSVDLLDGASLTVTVTFDDGTAQTEVYHLSTGKLRVVWNDDGTQALLPGLAGDDEAYFYGVYAASQSESRWFQWPVAGASTVSMSNPFGSWSGSAGRIEHEGIDIPAAAGTPITAAADGTVLETGFDQKRGNYLVLDHGDGLESVYAQCQALLVETGQTVTAGEEIAALGSTGMSTGPHLCFQVWQDGTAQDPLAYFDSGIRNILQAD